MFGTKTIIKTTNWISCTVLAPHESELCPEMWGGPLSSCLVPLTPHKEEFFSCHLNPCIICSRFISRVPAHRMSRGWQCFIFILTQAFFTETLWLAGPSCSQTVSHNALCMQRKKRFNRWDGSSRDSTCIKKVCNKKHQTAARRFTVENLNHPQHIQTIISENVGYFHPSLFPRTCSVLSAYYDSKTLASAGEVSIHLIHQMVFSRSI